MKLEVLNKNKEKVKEIELPDEVFAYPVKPHLIWEAIKAYLSNQRKGTASTKTRGEVSGGGRKPWRQKGLGRARAGSIRSPLWRHGGVTFGPKPRDYSIKLPKKMRRNALKSALSGKVRDKELLIVDDLTFETHKTKEFKSFLDKFELKSVLVVDLSENKNLHLASRNIPKVKFVDFRNLNVYDVMTHKNVLFSERGVTALAEVLK